jgi:hypothetical protein
MTYYYNKEVFRAFTFLTAHMRPRALRLTERREGASDRWLLAKCTGSEVECRFNGLTRQSGEERSIMSCCLPRNPIDSKYDSSWMDIGDGFYHACDVRVIDARGVAGS